MMILIIVFDVVVPEETGILLHLIIRERCRRIVSKYGVMAGSCQPGHLAKLFQRVDSCQKGQHITAIHRHLQRRGCRQWLSDFN